ncbi:MAG: diguanylate cyclase [Conexibacter sp.]|nr:diguanylate cyclase [Conexibacter sp.]
MLRQAPDHYEILDRGRVGRLAGLLFCCAGLLAAPLLALDPPTAAFGAWGWLPAAIAVALSLLFGVGLIVNQRVIVGTSALMAIGLCSPMTVGILQWLAGSASSYTQILILPLVWCAVVLPARRLLVVLLADTVVVFLPAAYGVWGAELLPQRIATLGIAWTLATLCLLWSDRIRDIARALSAQRAAADELARIDVLTGLGNRRALDEALIAQASLADRTGRPVAALVGDLDGFKRINDVHGHHTGDQLLRDVSVVLRKVVRRPDACFRWGGDEFVVLLGDADATEARHVAQRVSRAIGERCATPDGRPVTMTVGAAAHEPGAIGADLLTDADKALLAAKSGARAVPARTARAVVA